MTIFSNSKKYSKDIYDDIYYPKGGEYADRQEERAALVLIPYVLKRGIEIGHHGNHKLRQKETITFAGPVIINGIRGNMAVVVNMRGNHYYAHRVVMPDGTVFKFSQKNKEVKQEAYRGGTNNSSLANTTSITSNNSIPNDTENVNKKSYSFGEEDLDFGLYLSEDSEVAENLKESGRAVGAIFGKTKGAARFAISVYDSNGNVVNYQVYSATLLIRNDANGKKYLYDILDIKKENSSKLSASWLSKTNNNISSSHKTTVSQNATTVNTNSMQKNMFWVHQIDIKNDTQSLSAGVNHSKTDYLTSGVDNNIAHGEVNVNNKSYSFGEEDLDFGLFMIKRK